MNTNDIYFIQLDNNWFRNNLIKQIGVDGFYLLVNLLKDNRLISDSYKAFRLTKSIVCSYFGGTRTEYSKKAHKALKSLVENKIINIIDDYDLDKPKIKDFVEAEILITLNPKDNFFKLNFEWIDKINNYSGKANKSRLLAVFCAIRCNIYDNEFVSNYYYEDHKNLAKRIGLDKKTVLSDIEILEDLNLIMVDNPGFQWKEGETGREAPNVYVLYDENAQKALNAGITEYKAKMEAQDYKFSTCERNKKIRNAKRKNTCTKVRAEQLFEQDKISQEEYDKTIKQCDERAIDLLPYEVQKYLETEEMKEQQHSNGNNSSLKKNNNGWGTRHNIPGIDEEFLVDDEEDYFEGIEVDHSDDEKIEDEKSLDFNCKECNRKITNIEPWGEKFYKGYCNTCEEIRFFLRNNINKNTDKETEDTSNSDATKPQKEVIRGTSKTKKEELSRDEMLKRYNARIEENKKIDELLAQRGGHL